MHKQQVKNPVSLTETNYLAEYPTRTNALWPQTRDETQTLNLLIRLGQGLTKESLAGTDLANTGDVHIWLGSHKAETGGSRSGTRNSHSAIH